MEVSKFEHQSYNYVHFRTIGKSLNVPLSPVSYGLNSITIVLLRWCPRGVMVKAMDFGIVVCKFDIQSRYYIHFRTNTLGKGMNLLILPVMGYIVPLLFF